MIRSLKSRVRRDREQLEFLPAAVEVAETPVSGSLRWFMALLMVTIVLAIVWAYLGKIDVVARADGQLVPAGHVKAVQSIEPGTITTIHVSDGDVVKAGDVLITLDPTEETISQAEAAHQLIEASIARTCFRAGIIALDVEHEHAPSIVNRFVDEAADELSPYASGIDIEATAEDHRLSILAELTAIEQAKAAARNDERQKESDVEATAEELAGIRSRLPLLAEREMTLGEMLRKSLTEHWRWLEANLNLLETRQALRVGQHRLDEARAALQAIHARQMVIKADAIASFQQRVVEQDREATRGMMALQRAISWNARRYLKAPVDGVVSDLATHTQGGVLAAGDVAMNIVPAHVDLELEALVFNRDIAELREGQSVEVKIEALPFTRYGLIGGHVRRISLTSISDDELGVVFPIHVMLDQQVVDMGSRRVDLTPGMTATAEINIGDRRVIDFFLSPFQRYQDESLRER